jgi:hypothetical protein
MTDNAVQTLLRATEVRSHLRVAVAQLDAGQITVSLEIVRHAAQLAGAATGDPDVVACCPGCEDAGDPEGK